LFVVKKELLACSEYELCAAVYALQNAICKFHGRRLPQSRETFWSAKNTRTSPLCFPVFVRLEQQGPRAAEKEQRNTEEGGVRATRGFDLNCHTRDLKSDSGEMSEKVCDGRLNL
jgi:hypothetical protein